SLTYLFWADQPAASLSIIEQGAVFVACKLSCVASAHFSFQGIFAAGVAAFEAFVNVQCSVFVLLNNFAATLPIHIMGLRIAQRHLAGAQHQRDKENCSTH